MAQDPHFPLSVELFRNIEREVRDKSGRTRSLLVSVKRVCIGDGTLLYCCREVTERQQAERCQRLAARVLQRINESSEKTSAIPDILALVKEMSGFEAIAIRLREGDDFPYYETSGFPAEFVEAERYLCARDGAGRPIQDSQGKPSLECMCGTVIRGRTNPALPFFTEGGSFWTNSTTELLACTTAESRGGRARNRCNGEGYESVALIPLRYENEIIGLLQLNDTRKDMFTSELVVFFEGLGAGIGVAIARKRAALALREAYEQLETRVRERTAELAELNERLRVEMRQKEQHRIWLARQKAVLNAINRVSRGALTSETEEQVAQTCLTVAEELTDSQFGFVGEVNPSGRLDSVAISDPEWEACRMPRSDAVMQLKDMEFSFGEEIVDLESEGEWHVIPAEPRGESWTIYFAFLMNDGKWYLCDMDED